MIPESLPSPSWTREGGGVRGWCSCPAEGKDRQDSTGYREGGWEGEQCSSCGRVKMRQTPPELCLRPRRPGHGADGRCVLAGWAWRRNGEWRRAVILEAGAACGAGRRLPASVHLPRFPESQDPAWGSPWLSAHDTDVHGQVWRTHEGMWACKDACGHVSVGVHLWPRAHAHSWGGVEMHIQGSEHLGSMNPVSGAQSEQTQCGHTPLVCAVPSHVWACPHTQVETRCVCVGGGHVLTQCPPGPARAPVKKNSGSAPHWQIGKSRAEAC